MFNIKDKNALIIMSRAPVAGKTKTRLMSHLSGEECVDLHKAFLKDIVTTALSLKSSDLLSHLDIYIYYTPIGTKEIFVDTLKDIKKFEEIEYFPQPEKNLGLKMGDGIKFLLNKGYKNVVLIGSDIPSIQKEDLFDAYEILQKKDIAIGPTYDGGYYLIGMNNYYPKIFDLSENKWGKDSVLSNTIAMIEGTNNSYGFTNMHRDIDYIEDFKKYIEVENRETNSLNLINRLVNKCD